MRHEETLPEARTDGLLIEEVGDGETLVHDLDSHKTHCLNRTAALIWRHCDGRTTISHMADVLERELGQGLRFHGSAR